MARVLIVEDEHLFRRIITMNLVRHGYSVAEVDSVASAREALAAWDPPFDVILLDIELPDGVGWDILRHLSEMATAPPRVVVVTVARPRQVHLDEFRPDAVILKPFPVQALFRVIERVQKIQGVQRVQGAIPVPVNPAGDESGDALEAAEG